MSIPICKFCGKQMHMWVHYEKDRNYKYAECQNCHSRSKEKKIIYKRDNLNVLGQKGEVIEW